MASDATRPLPGMAAAEHYIQKIRAMFPRRDTIDGNALLWELCSEQEKRFLCRIAHAAPELVSLSWGELEPDDRARIGNAWRGLRAWVHALGIRLDREQQCR